MTQIKSIKGIVGRLPKVSTLTTTEKDGADIQLNAVLQTNLNINECACIDVEKVFIVLSRELKNFHMYFEEGKQLIDVAEKIATSNCLKWVEEE